MSIFQRNSSAKNVNKDRIRVQSQIFGENMNQLRRFEGFFKHVSLRTANYHRRIFVLILILCVIYYLGLYLYLLEEDYHKSFSYPLESNIMKIISQLKTKRKVDVEPINLFLYEFQIDSAHKCRNDLWSFEAIRLLFVIKSAVDHFENRKAIRQTWGWENRFSDVEIRRVFLLGVPEEGTESSKLQVQINAEHETHLDVVQAKFVDTYFNNTIKTMMGLHWVATRCPKAEFVMFVDDDYYVSAKNVLRYLRHPDQYPEYLRRAFLDNDILPEFDFEALPKKVRTDDEDDDAATLDKLTPESELFTGFKFASSKPHRIRFSKWFISLEEYPYDRFPPYITAGAYLLSYQTLLTLYYASLYTVPFRFDDIYLGILAKKANIKPLHNPNFFFDKPHYSKESYTYYIACHGYQDPEELIKVWNQQRSLGDA